MPARSTASRSSGVPALPADRCGIAIARLESDIRDNCAEERWRIAIHDGLIALRDALAPNTYTVEHCDELFRDAPRLARSILRIGGERERLASRVDALLASEVDTPAATLGSRVRLLVDEVRGHRGRVADLLHEAYTVDIGGRD